MRVPFADSGALSCHAPPCARRLQSRRYVSNILGGEVAGGSRTHGALHHQERRYVRRSIPAVEGGTHIHSSENWHHRVESPWKKWPARRSFLRFECSRQL